MNCLILKPFFPHFKFKSSPSLDVVMMTTFCFGNNINPLKYQHFLDDRVIRTCNKIFNKDKTRITHVWNKVEAREGKQHVTLELQHALALSMTAACLSANCSAPASHEALFGRWSVFHNTFALTWTCPSWTAWRMSDIICGCHLNAPSSILHGADIHRCWTPPPWSPHYVIEAGSKAGHALPVLWH